MDAVRILINDGHHDNGALPPSLPTDIYDDDGRLGAQRSTAILRAALGSAGSFEI